MPVHVNEFVIQAKVEGEEATNPQPVALTQDNLQTLKNEIINECIEKVEELLQKKEGR
jgi:hypothetical protein